jgi:hypothetical protein
MSTDRATINRENSLKSTGPKTESGKQRSDQFKPVGPLELHLVQSLADHAWRLNRVKAMENNIYALGLNQSDALIDVNHPEAHAALATANSLRYHVKTLSTLSSPNNAFPGASNAISNCCTRPRPNAAATRPRRCKSLAGSIFAMKEKTKHSKSQTL